MWDHVREEESSREEIRALGRASRSFWASTLGETGSQFWIWGRGDIIADDNRWTGREG